MGKLMSVERRILKHTGKQGDELSRLILERGEYLRQLACLIISEAEQKEAAQTMTVDAAARLLVRF